MSWTLIESQTLGASAASVTLGSGGTIPQTYKTLKVVISARLDTANTNAIEIRPNSDNTSGNYSQKYLEGNGASASSSSLIKFAGEVNLSTATSSTFASSTTDIPNYAGSTAKPMSGDGVTENNGTTAYQDLLASLWNQTTAITSLYIAPGGVGNFVSGSTFTLYGLK